MSSATPTPARVLLVVVWAASVGVIGQNTPTAPPLLVILLDGLRWDYVNLHRGAGLPGFDRFMSDGVRASHLNPVFPPTSLPNWHTIATGLYPESHGIVGDYMYDQARDQVFDCDDEASVSAPEWWGDAEPMWTTATRQDRDTALFTWARCDVPYEGVAPRYCTPYQPVSSSTLYQHLRTAVAFIHSQGYKLVMVHDALLETQGHAYGPFSSEVVEALTIADQALERLWNKLQELDMLEKVNVVVLSDHGIAWEGHLEEWVEVAACWAPEHVAKVVEYGGYMNVQPAPGHLEEVLASLRSCPGVGERIEVYLKDELPPRYHYSSHPRILDVIVLPKHGYFLAAPNAPYSVPRVSGSPQGHHGLDDTTQENREMRGVLYAAGPSFKSGVTVGPVDMVDVYDLLCRALRLSCHAHNGTSAHITPFFAPGYSHAHPTTAPTPALALVLALLGVVWR